MHVQTNSSQGPLHHTVHMTMLEGCQLCRPLLPPAVCTLFSTPPPSPKHTPPHTWGISAMALRSSFSPSDLVLTPSTAMKPDSISVSLNRAPIKLLLPAPVRPTTPTLNPANMRQRQKQQQHVAKSAGRKGKKAAKTKAPKPHLHLLPLLWLPPAQPQKMHPENCLSLYQHTLCGNWQLAIGRRVVKICSSPCRTIAKL